MGDHDELRAADYAAALRRWWLTVVVVAVAFAALAGFLAARSQDEQSSRVDIDVVPEVALLGLPDVGVLDGERVAAQMKSRLNRYLDGIESTITVDGVADLVRVTGSGTDTQAASDDALTVAQRFVDERRAERRRQHAEVEEFHVSRIGPLEERIDELTAQVEAVADAGGDTLAVQTQLVQSLSTLIDHQERAAEAEFLSRTSNADLADPMVVAGESGGIRTALAIVLGLIVGALVGIGVVLVRAHLDRRLRTSRQIAALVPDASIVEVVRAGADPSELAPLVHALSRAVDGKDPRQVELVGIDRAGAEAANALAGKLRNATMSSPNGDIPFDVEVTARDATRAQDEIAANTPATLLVARSGHSARYNLGRMAADMRLAAVPVVGVVLAEVPAGELAWAFNHHDATPVHRG